MAKRWRRQPLVGRLGSFLLGSGSRRGRCDPWLARGQLTRFQLIGRYRSGVCNRRAIANFGFGGFGERTNFLKQMGIGCEGQRAESGDDLGRVG